MQHGGIREGQSTPTTTTTESLTHKLWPCLGRRDVPPSEHICHQDERLYEKEQRQAKRGTNR